MKESVHDVRVAESPDDRKRRLARERQRRHREKIRARTRADTARLATNSDNPVNSTSRNSQFPVDARKRRDDDAVEPNDRNSLQRKSFAQRDSYIDAPDLHSTLEVRDRPANLTAKNAGRAVKSSAVHSQKPSAERSAAVLRRSERPFATKPSLRGEKDDREDKRLGVTNQRQSNESQKSQDRHQHVQQQHQRRQHQTQQQGHHQQDILEQQQQQAQARSADMRHRSTEADQANQIALLDHQRDHHTREEQQSELEKKAHREQHQRPPQRHDYARHDVLHQQPQLQTNTHAYSAAMHPQHTQQPQHHHDTGFGFPQPDVGVGQQAYVTDPHRQYVPDNGIQMGVTTRTYPRFPMRTRASMANAAAGVANVTGAAQGLQHNMANTAPGAVVGIHGGLALNRDPGATKFRQSQNNAVGGMQHASSQLSDGRDGGASVDPYAQNPSETPEQRKRRLARERQRRRRQRLKQDNGDTEKVEGHIIQRPQHDATRDVLTGPTGVPNAPLELPMHVRGAEPSMQPQASAAMHGTLTNFESPNLTSSHPLTSVHSLQVSGVPHGQDDLGGPATGRGGFSAHTLGVPGASPSPGVGSSVLGHPTVGDLHRFHTHSDEKLSRAQDPDEDPETRKRRLARDRQRRRRERLKSRKLGVGDVSGANVHDLKSAGAGNSKIGDGVGTRVTSDSERPVVASEGLGEHDRIPLGSTGPGVFAARADVAQSLSFGDQARNMRGGPVGDGSVPSMQIGLPPNMLNTTVHVNAVSLQLNNMVHWSQAFENEGAAKFAVGNAVATLQRQLPSNNPAARSYIIQQSIITLLGTEDAGRDLLNAPVFQSLRQDAVMRL